jgi:uridine kinase
MTKPLIITIAGGTASGKTTIAEKITEIIAKQNSVALITLDDYYLPGTEAKKFFPNESID